VTDQTTQTAQDLANDTWRPEPERNPFEILTASYEIPETNLGELTAKIEKISRRLVKLGMPAIETRVESDFAKPYVRFREGLGLGRKEWIKPEEVEAYRTNERYVLRFEKFFVITLTGRVPRFEGWDFVATLQHLSVDGESANILRTVPGFEGKLPDQFRTSAPDCDHCHTNRARKDTLIVRNVGTGEWKQVGRNCVVDFLFGKDPHAVIAALEGMQSAMGLCMGAGEGGGRSEERFGVEELLTHVAALVRVDGWMSRSKARAAGFDEGATVDSALKIMFPPQFSGPNAERDRREYEAWCAKRAATDGDKETVAKALAFAHEVLPERKDSNDYLFSLWVSVNQPVIGRREAGIAASLIACYLREVEQLTLRKLEQEKMGNSQHLGTVKERLLLTVTILRSISTSAGYSLTHDGHRRGERREVLRRFRRRDRPDLRGEGHGEAPRRVQGHQGDAGQPRRDRPGRTGRGREG
jgi:hypothetical protein